MTDHPLDTPPLVVNIREKRFGDHRVLVDFHLSLEVGEVVALTGPSGCGKTTALRIMAGLDTHFTGRVTHAPGARLAMVFQEPRLLPWRSVWDNLALVLPPDQRGDRGRIAAALADVGLSAAAALHPPALSLGMARRVAIARALIVEPDVLLLDEAFVSLDEDTAAIARDLLRGWMATIGRAAVLVSHDQREVAALATRVLTLGAEKNGD